jgi:hypothetical protein
MAAIDMQQDLRALVRQTHAIPPEKLDDTVLPPTDEPNVILVTPTRAFLFNRGRLARRSPEFARRYLWNLSDDVVDVVNDCPVVNLDDWAGHVYCFLRALVDDEETPYVAIHPTQISVY